MSSHHEPAPVHERFAVNGLQLHACRYGRRAQPCVILVHGGCAHLYWWDRLARALADVFHVVAIDLRGHGDSEHASPAAYTIADHARDLAALMAHLGVDQASIVGHSLGALAATSFAVQAPQRVRSLALIDSPARLSAASVRYLGRLRRFPHPVYKSYEQAIQRFRLLPTATTVSHASLATIAHHSLRRRDDGTWSLKFDRETLAQMEPLDLLPSLRQQRYPILFVRGEHSTVLTNERMAEALSAVGHARGVTVAGAHHHVMLDNPEGLERVLRELLDETPPSS